MLLRKLSILALIILCSAPSFGSAQGIDVRPFLIDEIAEARDIISNSIKLTNEYSDRKLIVFATVNEISIGAEGEIKEFVSPVMTDRTNTVTSWVEITRGRIEIEPGATIEVPLTLRIHPYAQPGEYHAFIGFVPESKRPKAEAVALRGDADGVIVKVTIADDKEESLRISGFLIDRFVVGEDNREVSIKIQNSGEVTSTPKGEVIFYNSKGEEVGFVPVNANGREIAPGEEVILTEQLPVDKSLGRYKANLALEYGQNQRASLADTTFFYSLPLGLILLVMLGIIILTLLITILFRRSFLQDTDDEDAHDVVLYVKDTHDAKPKDHDIDLTSKPD